MNEEKAARQAEAARKRRFKTAGIIVLCILGIAGLWHLAKGGGQGSSLLAVRADDWIKGNEKARATIVEYGDFQCPACSTMANVLHQMQDKFPDDLRLVFRNFPLSSIHKNAFASAQAAGAAGKQGKFWEMHDLLYKNQQQWSEFPDISTLFVQYAGMLGLNTEQFSVDMTSAEVAAKIDKDTQEASALNLTGTPSLFLNGEKISIESVEQLQALIQAAIDKTPAPAPEAPVSVHWHADLAVYIDGKKIDFSLPKYQSDATRALHEFVHLHDGNGSILHIHRTGITLQDFFKSLGMDLTQACIGTDNGERLCNSNTKSLKVYVNGKEDPRKGLYQPQDLDKILVSYGAKEDTSLKTQLDAVTDQACIYSEKCPERGKPPTEACVGGLGSGCEEKSSS